MAEVLIDFKDPEYWINPYPTLAAARAAGRTARTTTGGLVLLHADDADKVHMNPLFTLNSLGRLKALGITDGPFYEWRRYTLAVMEGKEHLRLRSYVGSAFAPRQMVRLRDLVCDHANALIDACAEAGTMEVLADFANDLPLWSMCKFIGIDEDDRKRIEKFMVGTEEGFSDPMTPEKRARVEASIVALNNYVSELIAQRRQEPRDDMVSLLVKEQAKPGGPSDIELLSLIVNIIGGSVGSTRAGFSNSVYEFARRPEQADLLRADPSLAPRAVEESLRFNPPFRNAYRTAKSDTNMFGHDFAPGEMIIIPRQAYNRDPERYEDPDTFNIQRPEKRHLSFGFGAHFCLGQAIARTNLQEGLKVFLARCHDIEIVSEPKRVPFSVDEQFESLHIRFKNVPRQS